MSWVQLVIFILIFGSSAITWIAKKINEERELKKIQDARQRQREEELRTGRTSSGAPARAERPEGTTVIQTGRRQKPVSGSPDDPKQRLKELAERRRAQLEELRRRQGGGQAQPQAQPMPQRRGPQPQTQPQSRPRQAPQPSAPQQRRRAEPKPTRQEQRQRKQEQRQQTGRQQQRQQTRQQQQQRRQQTPARPRPTTAEVRQERQERRSMPAASSSAPARPQVQGVARGVGPLVGNLRDPQELRKAIVMTELLGPPVSMRKPGQSVI